MKKNAAAVLPANHLAPPYLATQSQNRICATKKATQCPVDIGDPGRALTPSGP